MAEPVQPFLDSLVEWASTQSEVEAVALVGSYARGAATESSDVDLMLLVRDPAAYLADRRWLAEFGHAERHTTEEYGPVTSLRVWYLGGLEVEFGFATPDWAMPPLDEGTRAVIEAGSRILFERRPLLSPFLLGPGA